MSSNFSTNLKIELITTGEQAGTWGNTTNTNLGTTLEEAIVGYGNPSFSSDADLTISLSDSNSTQVARNLVLNVTSVALTATRNLVVPTIEKPYVVQNNTTGGQDIVVKTSGGSGVTVPNGKSMFLYTDGTNVVEVTTHTPISSGGTGASTAADARTNLGVAIGSDVQAYDADLTAIGALAKTDGNFIVGNGTTWVAESGSTARTSLGLGSIATQDSSSVSITGGSVSGITDLAVADGGTGASTANGALTNLLPSQTSNSGKYLTTDGTNTSWGSVPTQSTTFGAVGTYALLLATPNTNYTAGTTLAGNYLVYNTSFAESYTRSASGAGQLAYNGGGTALSSGTTWRKMGGGINYSESYGATDFFNWYYQLWVRVS